MRNTKQDILKMFLCIVIFSFMGCAAQQLNQQSFNINVSNSFYSAGKIYDATRQSLKELDKKGMLTIEQKIKIIDYAEDFWLAYQVALDSYETYLQTNNQAMVYSSLATLSKALGNFLKYSQTLQGSK